MDKRLSHHKVEYRGKQVILLGWREWVALPEFGVERIKAKIDTGARTSCLHSFGIQRFRHGGKDKVRFGVHPIQRNDKLSIQCVADLIDLRHITDSGAHCELRHIIETSIVIAGQQQMIEVSLTDRSSMTFRMLLGRKALQHFMVDPSRSFHT